MQYGWSYHPVGQKCTIHLPNCAHLHDRLQQLEKRAHQHCCP